VANQRQEIPRLSNMLHKTMVQGLDQDIRPLSGA